MSLSTPLLTPLNTSSQLSTPLGNTSSQLSTPIGNTSSQLSTPIGNTSSQLSTPLGNTSSQLSTPLGNTSSQLSTPLGNTSTNLPPVVQSHYQPDFTKQASNDLIDDILNDIDNNSKMNDTHNINMSTYNYSTDRSQVPDEKKYNSPDNFPSLENNNDTTYVVNERSVGDKDYMYSFFGLFNFSCGSLVNLIIVFIVVFLLSLTQINRLIFSLCPQFLKESGQVNIYGVILKSLIGVIIYLSMKFGSKIMLGNSNN